MSVRLTEPEETRSTCILLSDYWSGVIPLVRAERVDIVTHEPCGRTRFVRPVRRYVLGSSRLSCKSPYAGARTSSSTCRTYSIACVRSPDEIIVCRTMLVSKGEILKSIGKWQLASRSMAVVTPPVARSRPTPVRIGNETEWQRNGRATNNRFTGHTMRMMLKSRICIEVISRRVEMSNETSVDVLGLWGAAIASATSHRTRLSDRHEVQ